MRLHRACSGRPNHGHIFGWLRRFWPAGAATEAASVDGGDAAGGTAADVVGLDEADDGAGIGGAARIAGEFVCGGANLIQFKVCAALAAIPEPVIELLEMAAHTLPLSVFNAPASPRIPELPNCPGSAIVLLVTVRFIGRAVNAVLAFSSSTMARAPLVAPTASQLPPLSNLAARAMWCGYTYSASGHGVCHSPDSESAIVVNDDGKSCTLTAPAQAQGGARGSVSPTHGVAHPTSGSATHSSSKKASTSLSTASLALDPPSRR
jgi:hypothetical protein